MPPTQDVTDLATDTVATSPVEFNPFLPEFRADPYPQYHQLRSADPVHWSAFLGFWVLTCYADCVTVLRDAARFSADPHNWAGFEGVVQAMGGPGPLLEMQTKWMLLLDPPDLTHKGSRHIAFSQGIHHCLGAPLARVEAQIAINTLLRRMPALWLQSEDLEWRETVTLRELKALPMAF